MRASPASFRLGPKTRKRSSLRKKKHRKTSNNAAQKRPFFAMRRRALSCHRGEGFYCGGRPTLKLNKVPSEKSPYSALPYSVVNPHSVPSLASMIAEGKAPTEAFTPNKLKVCTMLPVDGESLIMFPYAVVPLRSAIQKLPSLPRSKPIGNPAPPWSV